MTGNVEFDKFIRHGARLVADKLYELVAGPSRLQKKQLTQLINAIHRMSAAELDEFLNGTATVWITQRGNAIFKYENCDKKSLDE